MTLDRAIELVKLERRFLYKQNDAASEKLRAELVVALDMAVCGLEAVQRLEKINKLKEAK